MPFTAARHAGGEPWIAIGASLRPISWRTVVLTCFRSTTTASMALLVAGVLVRVFAVSPPLPTVRSEETIVPPPHHLGTPMNLSDPVAA